MKRNLAIGCGLVLLAPLIFTIGSIAISLILVYITIKSQVPEGGEVHIISGFSVNNPPVVIAALVLDVLLAISGIIVLVRFGKKPILDLDGKESEKRP